MSSPSKPFFPERGLTKLDLVNYYIECAPAVVRDLRERPTVMKRWVDGVAGEPFFQKRVPAVGAGVDRDRDRHVPQRALRARARPERRRPPRLGREPRGDRLEPVARAPRRPRPSRRAARRPRPRPRGAVLRGARGRARRARGARRARPARLSQDLRLARHPHLRADRPRARLHRGAPRRARARAGGRAEACPAARPAAGGRRSARACSSTTTRTRATARSPRPTRSARSPTRACRARWSGTRSPTSTPPSCAWTRCPRGCASAAIPRPRSTTIRERSRRCSELAARDEREGLGDAPWPPHFRKQKNEPRRVQPSRAKR